MSWIEEAQRMLDSMPEQAKELRKAAENDLFLFARLLNPGYMYGDVHRKIFRWMQSYTLYGKNDKQSANKLTMLPRGHLKSHMLAVWAVWIIVRHPEVTILYLSATQELAITQLYAIKNMLDSSQFKKYWPEYLHPDVGLREKWSATKIIIDHPRRKEQNVRDATVATAGLTTNTTGWHADVIIADDLVVPENAYTEDGREAVTKKASQFTSIRNAGGFTMAAGTRYHPADIYSVWKKQYYEVYDENNEIVDKLPVWEIEEHKVETDGFFIWPRQVRQDGKAFGFDMRVLARIKAEYEDRIQFHAQYYNDPNDPESQRITRDKFQYYNPRFLKREGSNWFYNGNRLNVYAAIDFAFSLSKTADYTAIVVVGVDSERNCYVLDIDRFRSDKTIEYFKHIRDLHSKWDFKKLNAEVTVAQQVIVNDIKDFVKDSGLRLSVNEYRPSKAEGAKEERIAAVLEHRYDDLKMWHFEGGWTAHLEEELVSARPEHDDIKDALASALTIAVYPSKGKSNLMKELFSASNPYSRFGGVK